MSAFGAAILTMFRDRNISTAATYRVLGAGTGSAVRILISDADTVQTGFGINAIADQILIYSKIADTPGLARGDTFETASTLYLITSDPVRDDMRLAHRAGVRVL